MTSLVPSSLGGKSSRKLTLNGPDLKAENVALCRGLPFLGPGSIRQWIELSQAPELRSCRPLLLAGSGFGGRPGSSLRSRRSVRCSSDRDSSGQRRFSSSLAAVALGLYIFITLNAPPRRAGVFTHKIFKNFFSSLREKKKVRHCQ